MPPQIKNALWQAVEWTMHRLDVRQARKYLSDCRLGEYSSAYTLYGLTQDGVKLSEIGSNTGELREFLRRGYTAQVEQALAAIRQGEPGARIRLLFVFRGPLRYEDFGLTELQLNEMVAESYRKLGVQVLAECRAEDLGRAARLFEVRNAGGLRFEELGTTSAEVHGFFEQPTPSSEATDFGRRKREEYEAHLQEGRCVFDEVWSGYCSQPAVERGMCTEHAALACEFCLEPAVRVCPYATSLVCGAPLCEHTHRCPSHMHAIM